MLSRKFFGIKLANENLNKFLGEKIKIYLN